jgi:very-short-patch-repair endonuclease/predicted transcriptional regulator of viral defense system
MDPDRRCLEMAEPQHGLLTAFQAACAGLSKYQIRRRCQSGRWRRVHHGVYAINGAPHTWHQSLMAACLWGGPDALASHRAAARLWGLDGVEQQVVEISVPRKLKSDSVIVHRLSKPHAGVTRRDHIPVTDVTTTLFDLAAVLPSFDMEAALDSAVRMRMTHLNHLWDRLHNVARCGRNGVKLMRSLLEVRDPATAPSESQLELRLKRLIDRSGLAKPISQYDVERSGRVVARIDFAYPREKVAVEAQGYAYHHGRHQWEHDQERLSELTALGWVVLYVTYGQMKHHPDRVIQRIQRTLSLRTSE